MKKDVKNQQIAFKIVARLQGKANKKGELPLMLRYTFTRAGKTYQYTKSLKQSVAPVAFDDKAGVVKSNAADAPIVNALIANRAHLLRTAAAGVPDVTNWDEVSAKYDALVVETDARQAENSKRHSLFLKMKVLQEVTVANNLEDEVTSLRKQKKELSEQKQLIEQKEKIKRQELAQLAGIPLRDDESDELFISRLENYHETFLTSSAKFKSQILSWSKALIRFSKEKKIPLNFQGMNKAFYKAYGNWILFDEDNYDNWFGACVKKLKTFLNKCVEDGIAVNPAYRSFEVLSEKKEVIYLSPAEVDLVWNYAAGADKRKYQDLCVFGNLTGLRVGDILKSKYRIEDEMLKGRNTKNKSIFFIPLATDPRIEEILIKYNFNLAIVSEQKYNKYIKLLLKDIYEKHNLNQAPIAIAKYKWRQVDYEYIMKHDLISNHSSRRGFITNMYNVHKYEVEDIKAMIGSTSNEILKYLVVEQASVKQKAEEKAAARQAAILAKAKQIAT